jgi:uncharacterized protein YraI
MKSSTLAKLAVVVLVIGLSMQLSTKQQRLWAAAGQGVERQTVPTRTPTPEPATPTVPPPPATNTPVPPPATNTPLLPAPATTSAPTSALAEVTVNKDANVYSGPGLRYAIVGAVKAGDTAVVVGRTADSSWWQIVFQTSTAWISDTVVVPNSEAYNAQVINTSETAEAPPTVLPSSGGGLWFVLGGVFLFINGALLMLAGMQVRGRGR